jgi:hypothetical protein
MYRRRWLTQVGVQRANAILRSLLPPFFSLCVYGAYPTHHTPHNTQHTTHTTPASTEPILANEAFCYPSGENEIACKRLQSCFQVPPSSSPRQASHQNGRITDQNSPRHGTTDCGQYREMQSRRKSAPRAQLNTEAKTTMIGNPPLLAQGETRWRRGERARWAARDMKKGETALRYPIHKARLPEVGGLTLYSHD